MKKNGISSDIAKISAELLEKKYDSALNDGSDTASEALTASSAVSAKKLEEIASKSINGFSADSQKLYDYYRDIYSEGASKASENAYGLASANTGGYGNSYASSVAAAAYNDYMSGLYDEVDEVKQRAYDSTVDFADTAASYGDYSYLEALGADMSRAYKDEEYSDAVGMAKYGDYSGLEKLGIDTSLMRYSDLLSLAAELSEYGDYSGLEALGVDVTSLTENNRLEKALALAKYGDLSLLGEFSDNISSIKSKIGVSIQNGAAAAYESGGYSSLVKYLNAQITYGQINQAEKKRIISVITGN